QLALLHLPHSHGNESPTPGGDGSRSSGALALTQRPRWSRPAERTEVCGNEGGEAALARAIRRPEETVSDWANSKYLVDLEPVVVRITEVSRYGLRPYPRREAVTELPMADLT